MDQESIKRILKQGDCDVGLRVKKARVFLRLSQPDFALPLGISRSKLANIETGRTVLGYGLGIQVCRIFILNEWWLATGEGNVRDYQHWAGVPELLNVDQSRAFMDVFAEYFGVFLMKEESSSLGLDTFERIELILKQDGQNAWQLWNLLQYLLSVLDPRPEFPGHNEPRLVPLYRTLIHECFQHMIEGIGGQSVYERFRHRKDAAREEFEADARKMLDMMLKASPELPD